jgi:hypothetical protein
METEMTKTFVKSLPKISKIEIERLQQNGNVVFVYPRKGIAVVDGFKKYRIS